MKHTGPTQTDAVDPMTAYLSEVEQIAGDPGPDYVDPHVGESARQTPRGENDDVDPKLVIDSDGPTEDDLRRGDAVDMDDDDDQGDDDQGDDDQGDDDADDDTAAADDKAVVTVDPIEVAVAKVRELNPGMSLKQALAIAEQITGVAASADDDTPAAAVDAPPPVATLQEEMKSLQKDFRKALRDYADDDVIDKIEKRIEEIENLLPKAAQHEQEQATKASETFNHFANQAVQLYPDAAKEGSALYKRMAKIHQDLEATNNPLVNAPDKALKIAQMAANQLSIAPRVATKTATPPARRSTAPMTAPLAGTRTSAPRQTNIDLEIDKIQSAEDFENFVGMR